MAFNIDFGHKRIRNRAVEDVIGNSMTSCEHCKKSMTRAELADFHTPCALYTNRLVKKEFGDRVEIYRGLQGSEELTQVAFDNGETKFYEAGNLVCEKYGPSHFKQNITFVYGKNVGRLSLAMTNRSSTFPASHRTYTPVSQRYFRMANLRAGCGRRHTKNVVSRSLSQMGSLTGRFTAYRTSKPGTKRRIPTGSLLADITESHTNMPARKRYTEMARLSTEFTMRRTKTTVSLQRVRYRKKLRAAAEGEGEGERIQKLYNSQHTAGYNQFLVCVCVCASFNQFTLLLLFRQVCPFLDKPQSAHLYARFWLEVISCTSPSSPGPHSLGGRLTCIL